MSNFAEIVDNLENRINILLKKYETLQQDYVSLQEELTVATADKARLEEEIENSEGRIESLKAANAMLGSKDFKKETKLKINSLIREIDQCIVQLSE